MSAVFPRVQPRTCASACAPAAPAGPARATGPSFWAAIAGLLIAGALLTGCGGSGSPPVTAPPVTSFPVSAVLSGLAVNGGAFSGSRADSDGNQFTLRVVYAPDGAGRFTRRETLVSNGAAAAPVSTGFQFQPGAALFSIVGWSDSSGTAAVLRTSNSLPAVSGIGSSGAWFEGTVSGFQRETLMLTFRWSLEAGSDSSANLCLHMGYLFGLTGTSDIDCLRIDASGTILGFKSTKELRKSAFFLQNVYQ